MKINKKILESYLRHAKTAFAAIVVLVLAGVAKFQTSGGEIKFDKKTIVSIGAIVLIPLVQVWYQTVIKKRPDLAPEATFVETKVLATLTPLAQVQPVVVVPVVQVASVEVPIV